MKRTVIAAVALALAAAAPVGRAQQAQASKPAAATSSVALPPSVTYENLNVGRRMIVNLAAPRTEAILGRPADVSVVNLRSDSWYCEPADRTVATGAFVNEVRFVLESFLAGTVRPNPGWKILANDPDLDAFGAYLLDGVGKARIKATRTASYPSGQQSPAEMRFNDCYSTQELQAIKNEVARVLGPSN
jgi:hypothetical protein